VGEVETAEGEAAAAAAAMMTNKEGSGEGWPALFRPDSRAIPPSDFGDCPRRTGARCAVVPREAGPQGAVPRARVVANTGVVHPVEGEDADGGNVRARECGVEIFLRDIQIYAS